MGPLVGLVTSITEFKYPSLRSVVLNSVLDVISEKLKV